ncbi:MAG: hypothetical protein FD161_3134 [Limisphaerales bacterium]|nr:MAG: hypothetical protein FD161_3134 [Limisphaerales bacterium]TXT49120.1 MAG: hypothetical protein FD140_3229 [Limisphaerales bacterium]
MKLETFFEKFDQFADAPDAVAKMRELVLELSANGATHTSLGQRPRKTVPHWVQALKGRASVSAGGAMWIVKPAEWIALSGLGSFVDAIPRALPWAGIGRRVAAVGGAR